MDISVEVLEISQLDLTELELNDAVREYKKMRDLSDYIKEIASRLQSKIDDSKTTVLPQMFKEKQVTSISVDGYRYTVSHTVRASIASDKKAEAYAWLRENELGELITETVNSSTLAAQARKMLEDGEELNPDLFKVATIPNVSVTKV